MSSAVLIDKNGELKNVKLSNPSDISELYKKCGFRSEKGFEKCGFWEIDNKCIVEIYGKKDGKSGTENKYELPPPNDNFLLFGNCIVLVKDNKNEYGNLSIESWEKIYEKLFGGFESLGEEDSESSEEEEISPDKLTKHGYKKDGFIVDDDDSEDLCEHEYTGSELTDEEYYYSDD